MFQHAPSAVARLPLAARAEALPALGAGQLHEIHAAADDWAAALAFAFAAIDAAGRRPVMLVHAARQAVLSMQPYGEGLIGLGLDPARLAAIADAVDEVADLPDPVGETVAIIYLAPFAVLVLSGPLLGEKVRPAGWLAAFAGFAFGGSWRGGGRRAGDELPRGRSAMRRGSITRALTTAWPSTRPYLIELSKRLERTCFFGSAAT